MPLLDKFLKQHEEDAQLDALNLNDKLRQIEAQRAADLSGLSDANYAPPGELLDTLPSGARLFAVKKYAEEGKAQDAAAIHQWAEQNAQQARAEMVQRATDRRADINKLLNFDIADYGTAKEQAPQLDGLRSDIVVDPKTMSFTQKLRQLTPEQERSVKDQEVADWYGVPVEYARAKREKYEAVQAKAAQTIADRKYIETIHDAKLRDLAHKEQNAQINDINELGTQAQGLINNNTWATILAMPDKFDDRTKRAAYMAKSMTDNADALREAKSEQAFENYLLKKYIAEKQRPDALGQQTLIADMDLAGMQRAAKTQAHLMWQGRQSAQAQRVADAVSEVGSPEQVDAALNNAPGISPSIKRGANYGALLGAAPLPGPQEPTTPAPQTAPAVSQPAASIQGRHPAPSNLFQEIFGAKGKPQRKDERKSSTPLPKDESLPPKPTLLDRIYGLVNVDTRGAGKEFAESMRPPSYALDNEGNLLTGPAHGADTSLPPKPSTLDKLFQSLKERPESYALDEKGTLVQGKRGTRQPSGKGKSLYQFLGLE